MTVATGPVRPESSDQSRAVTRHLIAKAAAYLLHPFIVPSSSGENLAYLDGVRAIAVAMVVVFHSWYLSGTPDVQTSLPWSGRVVDLTPFLLSCGSGIDLFFVLSGFLLSQRWFVADFEERPRPAIGRYIRLRLLRIVPAYYCCIFLLLLFFTPTFFPSSAIFSWRGIGVLASYLLFLHYLVPFTSGYYSMDGSLWTLTIEMLFYLTLPFAVVLFLRRRWLVTLPIAVGVTLLWAYLCKDALAPIVHAYQATVSAYGVTEPTVRFFLHEQFPGHFAEFGFGIVLANLVIRKRLDFRMGGLLRSATGAWAAKAYFVVGVAVILLSMDKIGRGSALFSFYLREISLPLGFALMLAGIIWGGPWLRGLFGVAPLQFIGIIGYSLFLWHFPVVMLLNRFPQIAALPPTQRFPHVLWHTTIAVIPISIASFLLVEKPFLLRGRQRQPAAPRSFVAKAANEEPLMRRMLTPLALVLLPLTIVVALIIYDSHGSRAVVRAVVGPATPVALRIPAAASTTPYPAGAVAALPRATLPTRFAVERVNAALIGPTPGTISVPRGTPITVQGWAVDVPRQQPAGAVILSIDNVLDVASVYGNARPDVAQALGNDAYRPTGFTGTIPTDRLTLGRHLLVLKIVTSDGHEYYQPAFAIEIEIVER
jgi:peptidoglycan/LPS O-acetylase OafA/YrhL